MIFVSNSYAVYSNKVMHTADMYIYILTDKATAEGAV